jgi:hypothetical protein
MSVAAARDYLQRALAELDEPPPPNVMRVRAGQDIALALKIAAPHTRVLVEVGKDIIYDGFDLGGAGLSGHHRGTRYVRPRWRRDGHGRDVRGVDQAPGDGTAVRLRLGRDRPGLPSQLPRGAVPAESEVTLDGDGDSRAGHRNRPLAAAGQPDVRSVSRAGRSGDRLQTDVHGEHPDGHDHPLRLRSHLRRH